jgi:hypothetical protein
MRLKWYICSSECITKLCHPLFWIEQTVLDCVYDLYFVTNHINILLTLSYTKHFKLCNDTTFIEKFVSPEDDHFMVETYRNMVMVLFSWHIYKCCVWWFIYFASFVCITHDVLYATCPSFKLNSMEQTPSW